MGKRKITAEKEQKEQSEQQTRKDEPSCGGRRGRHDCLWYLSCKQGLVIKRIRKKAKKNEGMVLSTKFTAALYVHSIMYKHKEERVPLDS